MKGGSLHFEMATKAATGGDPDPPPSPCPSCCPYGGLTQFTASATSGGCPGLPGVPWIDPQWGPALAFSHPQGLCNRLNQHQIGNKMHLIPEGIGVCHGFRTALATISVPA